MGERWLLRISNWHRENRRPPIGKRLLLLSVLLFLPSCIEVKQRIDIGRNGSGEAILEIGVQREWAPMVIPKLKADAPRGWIISNEKETEGKHVIVFTRKFRDISEVNDDEAKYFFWSKKAGFMQRRYTVEVTQLKSSDLPFPFELSIKVPGTIDETNGMKISSSEARWNLQGLRRGRKLSIAASAFAMPDYGSWRTCYVLIAQGEGISSCRLLLGDLGGSALLGVGVILGAGLIARKAVTIGLRNRKAVPRRIFCTECGQENPATGAFCTNCGQRLR